MASCIWKKIEKSIPYRRVKLLGKRVIGLEPWLRFDCRPHSELIGGWRLIPAELSANSIVYSLGIGKDVRLDQELIKRFGLTIYAFDPTPSTVLWLDTQNLSTKFAFYPWAISDFDGKVDFFPRTIKDGKRSEIMYTMIAEGGTRTGLVTVPAYKLQTITTMFNHSEIDLLKMDIEGAEYDVLTSMLDARIAPKQLLVEFHHRFPGMGVKKTTDMVDRLRGFGYALFAISETGREFSFLRK